MFMNCLQLQEEEAMAGKKNMTTVVYKGHMRAHSKYRDELTQKLDQVDGKAELENVPAWNTSALTSALGLHPDEIDK